MAPTCLGLRITILRTLPRKCPPILLQTAQLVRFVVGPVLLLLFRGRLVLGALFLQHRIGLDLLTHHVLQLQGGRLQDFQTLTHLGRQHLLLPELDPLLQT